MATLSNMATDPARPQARAPRRDTTRWKNTALNEGGASGPLKTRSNLSFEDESSAVLSRLVQAAKALVEAAPVPVHKAADLHRALGVRPSLGWEVFRLAMTNIPLHAIAFVPKPEPMAKVLEAARAKRFQRDAIDQLAASYATFRTFMEEHAHDRETFDSMVAGLGHGTGSEPITLRQRRAAFSANSRLWGFQVSVVHTAVIWHAGRTPSTEDCVRLTGVLGLRQHRQLAAVPLVGRGFTIQSGQDPDKVHTPPSPCQVLEDFSSSPLPSFSTMREGHTYRELVQLSGVGKNHDFTGYFLQETGTDLPVQEDPGWGVASMIASPCALHVLDLLVPVSWSDPASLYIDTYGNPADMMAVLDLPDRYRMPSPESPQYLGAFLDSLRHPEVPKCPDIVRSVLLRYGWQNTVFDIYRCSVQYPIMHTLVHMEAKGIKSPMDPSA